MSIQALPESTTRRLGAGQALPSPAALVKELLDNAIDARATSIEVLLSANILDKIEVRDNGSGIAADDLKQVGKRGHTSKLTCFEELRAVGRASLGFRGEALASACTMGEVVITTRTEGDPVATSVKLKPCGGVNSRSSKSRLIGTTVYVSNLFSKFPVRKQNFLKQTSKTISEIKDLLQSYALARLHIRLSLKVTKSLKANWTFVSRKQDGLKEAAAKVVGKEIAALCREEAHDLQGHKITINVLLPQPGADLSKVKGGCHVSVDGRPLSSSRQSLARKIYTGYKEALKELARKTGQELCKDPFFYLRISCAGDIYDPNVEPAKDDIIFVSGDSLVTSFDEFFRSIYPPPAIVPQEQFPQRELPIERPVSALEANYDALLVQQLSYEAQELDRAAPSISENGHDTQALQTPHDYLPRARSQVPFISLPVSSQVANSLDSALNPWSISNSSAALPQTYMQPPFQLTSGTTLKQEHQHRKPLPNTFQTPPASGGKSLNQILPHTPYNTSPFSALPSKPPPGQKTIESWPTHSDGDPHLDGPPRPPTSMIIFDEDALLGHTHHRPRGLQSSYRSEQEIVDVERPARKQQKVGAAFLKRGSLSTGMNAKPTSSSQTEGFTAANALSSPSPGVSRSHHESSDDLPMISMDDEPHMLGLPIHPSQRQLPNHPEDEGFDSYSQSRGGSCGGAYRGKASKPFQSHRRKSVSKSDAGSHRHTSGPDLPMMSLDYDEPAQTPIPEDDPIGHGTSEQALDFEHRKIQATSRLREENALREMDRNNVMRSANLEHKSRMLGRIAGIAREDQLATGNRAVDLSRPATAFTEATSRPGTAFRGDQPRTVLPHDDPRACLMKKQRSMNRAGHRIKRCKTALPLETVQAVVDELHGLVLMMGITDVNKLAMEREKMGRWDEYISNGEYKDGLEMDEVGVEEVEERIRCVMEAFEARSPSQGLQGTMLL